MCCEPIAGADGSFADCTEKLISTDLLAQLEQRVQEEEDKVETGEQGSG